MLGFTAFAALMVVTLSSKDRITMTLFMLSLVIYAAKVRIKNQKTK
jgi:hypothetical protein